VETQNDERPALRLKEVPSLHLIEETDKMLHCGWTRFLLNLLISK